MSRPTVWGEVWNNFWASLSRGRTPPKKYIGVDVHGNRFYEFAGRNPRSNVKRGYDAHAEDGPKPSVEWLAWISGTRRFPPSNEEIALNKARAQMQLEENLATARRTPQIASEGRGAADVDRPTRFPIYNDAEIAPGAERRDDKLPPSSLPPKTEKSSQQA